MICTCGNNKFYASMNATVKVLVDEDGDKLTFEVPYEFYEDEYLEDLKWEQSKN